MTGDTSLHIAAKHGDIRMITLLLKFDADKYIKNLLNKTPYNIAENSDEVGVRFLFSSEFNPLLGIYGIS